MSNYWFKRKRYGWGWTPVTWQGWLSVILYLVVVLGGALSIKDMPEEGFPAEGGIYTIVFLVATTGLIIVSHKHGPTPKWRWGKTQYDNPDEDY